MSMTTGWYPIVFPDRCDGCQGLEKPKCVEFCPHTVFALMGGKAVVANPQNCVEGCVACMPLCPRKAIEFPRHPGSRRGDRSWSEGLRRIVCRKCGRVFWTNEDRDLCWECSGSSG
ncbi:MAG: ferredoxin family protein [Thermoproteota archaeon]